MAGRPPAPPGEAAKQWLKDLYQENKLINNTWELDGRTVDLAQVTMPVLNIYAEADHIIPPPTARALTGSSGPRTTPSSVCRGGHIGMFVSSKSQGIVGRASPTGSPSATTDYPRGAVGDRLTRD